MTQTPNDAVHPNVARLAAAYDSILDQLDRGQLTSVQARAKISQLEARDDQGVRWSIDPDTGGYVRKTAFGEMEYDAPPMWGVRTNDAFDYTANPLVENPNSRLVHVQMEQMMKPPTGLAGATQAQGAQRPSMKATGVLDRVAELPGKAKVALVAAVLVALTGVFVSVGGDDAPKAPPSPATTAPAKAPAKKAPAKKVPAKKPTTAKR